MYTIVSTSNMSIRPEPNTANDRLAILPAKIPAKGEELVVLDNGDKWLYITEGWSVEGWVAVIHAGKTYCSLTGAPTPTSPPAGSENHPQSFRLIDDFGAESLYFKVQ